MERATVKEGDILIINTGYHRYSWDQPDVYNPKAPRAGWSPRNLVSWCDTRDPRPTFSNGRWT